MPEVAMAKKSFKKFNFCPMINLPILFLSQSLGLLKANSRNLVILISYIPTLDWIPSLAVEEELPCSEDLVQM